MSKEIYNKKGRYDNPVIIDAGEEGDYFWIIISLGGWPCAYVGIKVGHPLFAMNYDEIYEKGIELDVHGGITYTDTEVIGLSLQRWWIGWDYAHSGDYSQYRLEHYSEGKKWTVPEIKEDIKEIIKQLRKEADEKL